MAKAKKKDASRRLSAKHERFAQATAEGMTGADAYVWAGYKVSPKVASTNAGRLLKNAGIRARIDALLKKRQEIDANATAKAVEKLAITKERILSELAKIGFADIRKAVKWHGHLIQEQDNPSGGDILVVKNTYSNHVSLISSEELDDETAGAIAEVSQSPTGGLRIKLHDKRAALVDMGKHLGMFKDLHEHTGKNGDPIETASVVVNVIPTTLEEAMADYKLMRGQLGI